MKKNLPLERIEFFAAQYRLDPALIIAICQVESDGVGWKTRFEPHTEKYLVQPRDFASVLGISVETERILQMQSWGHMQVMGFVARELGFKDYLTKLCLSELGIAYGCRKLRQLFDRYGAETDVISAYNQGSPRKTRGGMYQNQRYVDKVSQVIRELRK